MALKPITLYACGPSPNPWKVAMILEELGIPYNMKMISYEDVKKEPFVSINPNGRVPAIEDPNTDLTLWESGAIIEYLVETYDNEHRISFSRGSKDYFRAKQWLHFQMSGQGPYFGQAYWFSTMHPEKLPSAQERYKAEVLRIFGVLDVVLAKSEYLVGGRLSYADIAFLPWSGIDQFVDVDLSGFLNVHAWLKRQQDRPAIAKAMADRRKIRTLQQ